ncbi:MAG TPA: cytochrome C oxidase subunit IV family protein [Pyrinomonadaceae bacterium]|jgi:cytochrome c oxidase subunit 4
MSALGKNLLKEDVIINVICLILAAGIIALAVMNVSWDAGMAGLITTDNLFFIVVCLLLAGVLLISPLMWLHSRGILKNPFTDDAEAVVDTTPIHFEGSTKLFLMILGALLGLTLVEVFLAYVQVSVVLMLVILLGLSIIKAALIVAYFMHLRFERLSLVLTIVPALVICICLLFVFFPDSFRSSSLRYKYTPPAPTEATAPAEESH